MSVYQRKRNLSDYEFYSRAIAIRVEVNKLMASPIVYNITRADQFFPNTSFNVLERRKYLTLAIADCEQLCLDFQCLLELGLPINVNRFDAVVESIELEISLLKGARKNVKLVGKQSAEDLIESTAAELERLRAL